MNKIILKNKIVMDNLQQIQFLKRFETFLKKMRMIGEYLIKFWIYNIAKTKIIL